MKSKYGPIPSASVPSVRACALWRNPKSSISRNKSTLFSGATDREREPEKEGARERGREAVSRKIRQIVGRARAARDAAIIIKLKREIYPERGRWRRDAASRGRREGEIFLRANSVHDSVLIFLTFFLYPLRPTRFPPLFPYLQRLRSSTSLNHHTS